MSKSPNFRDHARSLAGKTHSLFQLLINEPLDGDQTEELSIMFREELDVLNGNLSKEELDKLRGESD